jgi:hypothetical protein
VLKVPFEIDKIIRPTVGKFTFEKSPDCFVWIELGGIRGEVLQMQPGN